ncbi:MAG: methylmalonyl-CoA carboxyltransferase [Chloroflexi bacterium]|nr:methylmalonyl-CoA carboxyltransferase [Chloroflexota bacterium]MDA1296719.1 methylmalonyl-CoA carboxyltransferase [Chloroflexota bacterium]
MATLGGGAERVEAQHKRGKLTARERLHRLFDDGSFTEIDTFVTHRSTDLGLDRQRFEGDAVVTGFGQVEGRTVFAYAQDFTVLGGSLSLVAAQKISKVMDHAVRTGAPIVGINDSGGARIQEGVDSLAGYGEIFKRNTLASGVVPQITVIAGPSAGGAVYSPAITDFIYMVEGIGQMYITGPDVVKAVTGEEVSHEELGGAAAHASRSGVAHFTAPDEDDCYRQVRRLLSFLPSNNSENAPERPTDDDPERRDASLGSVIPASANQPYNVMDVVLSVVDDGDFLPVHHGFAGNIVVGFAHLEGRSIGVVANQPAVMAGMLDIDASDKAARFVRFCDAFNIPLLTFVDVPGFMPGTHQEYGGIIRHGAKLLYAYSEATVPKMAVILRKAYGGAYIVMSSKELRSDLNLAWPTAEIAVMGPEGAVNVISRREIAAAEDQDAKRAELVADYRDRFANPYIAANRGYIDDVIDPVDTRPMLIRSLRMLETKVDSSPPKKHGNIPL